MSGQKIWELHSIVGSEGFVFSNVHYRIYDQSQCTF